jgi:hypothetical protein
MQKECVNQTNTNTNREDPIENGYMTSANPKLPISPLDNPRFCHLRKEAPGLSQTILNRSINEFRLFKKRIDERYISRVDGFFKPYTSRLDFVSGLAHPVTYPVQEAFRAGLKYPVLMILPALSVLYNLITLNPIEAAKRLGAFSIYAGLAIASAVVAVLSSLLAVAELITRSGSTIVHSCINAVSGLKPVEGEAPEAPEAALVNSPI